MRQVREVGQGDGTGDHGRVLEVGVKKLAWNPTMDGTSEIASVGTTENIGDLCGEYSRHKKL
jgi:hypothetical protein